MNSKNQICGHEVSLYNPNDGNFVAGTQGDLWNEVTRLPCWVVDNNVAWERTARAEPLHHFVLGRTMVLESDSLRGAAARLQREPLQNVFTLEILEILGRKVLAIDRLGSTLQFKFRGRIPTVESRTIEELEAVNSTQIREAKRQWVRQLEQRDPTQLRLELNTAREKTKRNYAFAGQVSLMAYAIHLGELRRMKEQGRVQRFDQNHPNLFGDAEIIQEAMFLGVGIYSNDRVDVAYMAELLGITMRSD